MVWIASLSGLLAEMPYNDYSGTAMRSTAAQGARSLVHKRQSEPDEDIISVDFPSTWRPLTQLNRFSY